MYHAISVSIYIMYHAISVSIYIMYHAISVSNYIMYHAISELSSVKCSSAIGSLLLIVKDWGGADK